MVTLLVAVLSRVKRHHIWVLLGAAASSIVIGAIVFALTQHVSFGTGLYWAIVTAATVGYGDVTPHNSVGRIVAAVVILTTIPLLAAVFALVTGLAAATQIRRLFDMDHALPDRGFTAVYGSHPSVSRIVEELVTSGRQVLLVAEIDASEVHDAVRLLAGDPTSEAVIRKSRPDRAADALVVGAGDADVLVTCVALRSAAPSVPIYALADSPKVAQALRELGIRRTLASNELVAHVLAKSLEAPHAGDLLLRLIDSDRYRMEETPVEQDMVGRRASELELDGGAIVLGIVRDGEVKLVLDDDAVARAGDALVTLAGRSR
jgi:voltage-gated potassium channel